MMRVVATIAALFAAYAVTWWRRRNVRAAFAGRHVLVTGGSSGLGLEVARQLVAAGACVTIVARNVDALRCACASIESDLRACGSRPSGCSDGCCKGGEAGNGCMCTGCPNAPHPNTETDHTCDSTGVDRNNSPNDASDGHSMRICYVSADVTRDSDTEAMFSSAAQQMGQHVDDVFCCAGASVPGMFVEQPSSVHAAQMEVNYLGAVRTARAFLRHRATGGRIVLVSSTLGCTGMVGYAQYAPTKHAVRGLAASLRQELLPRRTAVHVYVVGTIDTPGYAAEQRTKPRITQALEEGDTSDRSPAARARALLAGVASGRYAIASDALTYLFVLAAQGTDPAPDVPTMLLERLVLGPIAGVALAAWRWSCDRTVVRYAAAE